MSYAGIKLAGNSNQTLVAIQNTAMRLSQHSDGGGSRDGGEQRRSQAAIVVSKAAPIQWWRCGRGVYRQ